MDGAAAHGTWSRLEDDECPSWAHGMFRQVYEGRCAECPACRGLEISVWSETSWHDCSLRIGCDRGVVLACHRVRTIFRREDDSLGVKLTWGPSNNCVRRDPSFRSGERRAPRITCDPDPDPEPETEPAFTVPVREVEQVEQPRRPRPQRRVKRKQQRLDEWV